MSGIARPSLAIVERNASLRVEQHLSGCFRSHLVIDSEDAAWVMKADRRVLHEYGLINELLGWEFCHRLGIPASPYKLVELPDARNTGNGATFVERRTTARLCFLSRYVPDLEPGRCCDLLPSVYLSRVKNKHACLGMFIFDIWADHRDRRQAVFSDTGDGLKATFIDNTHLFGGVTRNDEYCPGRLSSVEIVALSAVYEDGLLDRWIESMRRVLPSALKLTLELLPSEWRAIQKRDYGFERKFNERLEQLEDLVDCAIDRARDLAPPFRTHQVCIFSESESAMTLPLV
jgi:hypothetical protein